MTERELAEELAAHTYSAHELAKQLLQFATHRDESRQRMAKMRSDKPTRHAQNDAPQRELQRA